jgi:uncharacterized protein
MVPPMPLRLVLLSALLLAGCKLDGFLYAPERVSGYSFDPQGKDAETTITAAQIEPLDVVVDDEVTVKAVYVKSSQQPPKGYVLFFHGKSSHLDLEFHRIKRFSNYGYDVMAFDYRGFGASSDVEITEEGIGKDSAAVLALLRTRIPQGDPRLIFWGDSFGTATASQCAHAENPRGLILEEPFASLKFFAQDASRMDIPGTFVNDAQWDTAGRVHDLKLVPKLIVHGTADELIDQKNSQYIYDHAQEPKRLVFLEGGTHGRLHEVEGYQQTINSFLDELVP